MSRGDAYTYRDARTFRVRDRRQNRNYMVFFESELIYLIRFDIGRAAIVLYLFIGTRASGNTDGWDIGITELEDKLLLGRSTIYKAVAQLINAGLLKRCVNGQGRHLTVELVDVKPVRWPRSEEVETLRDARRGQRLSTAIDKSKKVSPERLSREPTSSKSLVKEKSLPSPSLEGTSPHPRRTVGKLTVPLELVQQVWHTLRDHSQNSEEGEGVFTRAMEADPTLVDRIVVALRYQSATASESGTVKLPAVWNGSLRRRWVSAALVEAGGWGQDGLNFS
jgi:hypothetical protein